MSGPPQNESFNSLLQRAGINLGVPISLGSSTSTTTRNYARKYDSNDENGNTGIKKILWTARITSVDFKSGSRLSRLYDSPVPIVLGHNGKQKGISQETPQNPASPEHVEGHELAIWNDYVFQVECEVKTPSLPENAGIEELVIDYVSDNRIIIRSPFLLQRLKAIANYYPGLFDNDNMVPKGPFGGNYFSFPETWGFLLHRFQAMEAFLQDKDEESSTSEKQNALRLEKEHIQLLYEFLKPHYENLVASCLNLLDRPTPRISFETLWYIFPLGTDVYFWVDSVVQVGVVYKTMNARDAYDDRSRRETGVFLNGSEPRDQWAWYEPAAYRRKEDGKRSHPPPAQPKSFPDRNSDPRAFWRFYVWYLATDGRTLERTYYPHDISRFEGLRSVTELSLCPVDYWDKIDGGERRRRIIQRNTMLARTLREGHLQVNYNGPCRGVTAHYSGKVVVDHRRGVQAESQINSQNIAVHAHRVLDGLSSPFSSYNSIQVYGGADEVTHTREEPKDYVPDVTHRSDTPGEDGLLQEGMAKTHKVRELTEHQLLLIYPRAWAFALKTKQWLLVQPDHMTETTRSTESLDNLVLDEVATQTIRALATRQSSQSKTWAADFIEGKGTGQIMLLHGPPGVGKTYTVEAIAEFLHRPLLALTIADIGTQETKVENELFKWFTLAEAWSAVLLVDEADIFLERRQNRDLGRNGLVAAFLRRMEYFKGLLFLTTNRVGQIDDAFISRVHAAIGYPPFTPQDRVKIWQGFFNKLEKERAGKIQISPDAKRWVVETAESGRVQLNGREIRNALQTAISLAEAELEESPDFEAGKQMIVVNQSHFERVLEISERFHSYMRSIRQDDEQNVQ
ncbi:hypothetical protein F4777DRAFT_569791 [Nemania sp. FL0916]|nr:hypothetical protein F4777DRAFT_569791 [Nemania sp. FL0916]